MPTNFFLVLYKKNNVVAIHFVLHKKNLKKFPFAQRKQLDDLYYKQDQELLDSIVPETEEEVKLIIGKAAIPEFTLRFFANGFCRFRFEKLKISLKHFWKYLSYSTYVSLLYIVSRVFQMKWWLNLKLLIGIVTIPEFTMFFFALLALSLSLSKSIKNLLENVFVPFVRLSVSVLYIFSKGAASRYWRIF